MNGVIGIDMICVGKLKEKYLKDACEEYKKRIGKFAKLSVIEVGDLSSDDENMHDKVLEEEARLIEKQIKKDSFVISMCIEGMELSSPELARRVSDLNVSGKSHITFIIGGSIGLSRDLKKRSDLKLSFSKLTFPHQLMRLILLEQLYRVFKINAGESYHK